MNVLLLGGSPSAPSTTWRLLQLLGERLGALGHRMVALQVRQLPAEALLRADPDDAVLREALRLVREADAIVVGTPVYKASFSGALKVFLDLLPQDGLDGKLVLPVATGGSQSHMLALDYALRPVLASLGPRPSPSASTPASASCTASCSMRSCARKRKARPPSPSPPEFPSPHRGPP
jgi:FMN reductase